MLGDGEVSDFLSVCLPLSATQCLCLHASRERRDACARAQVMEGHQPGALNDIACACMAQSRKQCVRAGVQVMEVYQPGAIVVCGGADSLSGDRLGCFNLSLDVRGPLPLLFSCACICRGWWCSVAARAPCGSASPCTEAEAGGRHSQAVLRHISLSCTLGRHSWLQNANGVLRTQLTWSSLGDD